METGRASGLEEMILKFCRTIREDDEYNHMHIQKDIPPNTKCKIRVHAVPGPFTGPSTVDFMKRPLNEDYRCTRKGTI